ncbi:ribonuclease H family protein [Halomonas sp. NO4]|uniref:ribonuclease H family protein n=1 Tax=Halomonas sp. NO4 TaxID=2484813 RepID=UPI0013D05DCC|nr:ribonuclease H family protein [Halomonas sp. NO4]
MARKARKWYVVWEGREPGVYTTWTECERQVKGVSDAKFKSFASQAEAEAAFATGARPTGRAKPSRQRAAPGKDRKRPLVDVEIFCDGACEPNPGPAGSGLALYRGGTLSALHYGLYTPEGTNNTAELLALHEALKLAHKAIAAGESVRIRADSNYAIQCISTWAYGWKKRGWRRANGDPVKNPEIIASAHELFRTIADRVELAHVRGHAGIEGNELADRMAMLAATECQAEFVAYAGDLDVPTVLALQRG